MVFVSEEIIFHLKRISWKGCVTTSERFDKILLSNSGLKNFAHVCTMHQTSFWGTWNIVQGRLCCNIRKSNKLKVKHVLQIASAHFIRNFWKQYHEVHVSLPWCTRAPEVKAYKKLCIRIFDCFSLHITFMVIFIEMNTYILTEGRNFKTFVKKNYGIAFYSC